MGSVFRVIKRGKWEAGAQSFITLLLILILLLLTISAADLTTDFQGDPDFCPTLSQSGLFASIYPATFSARALCCLWWRISDGLIAAVEANYANLNMLSLHRALLMPLLAARDRRCQLFHKQVLLVWIYPWRKKRKKTLWSRFFSESESVHFKHVAALWFSVLDTFPLTLCLKCENCHQCSSTCPIMCVNLLDRVTVASQNSNAVNGMCRVIVKSV